MCIFITLVKYLERSRIHIINVYIQYVHSDYYDYYDRLYVLSLSVVFLFLCLWSFLVLPLCLSLAVVVVLVLIVVVVVHYCRYVLQWPTAARTAPGAAHSK